MPCRWDAAEADCHRTARGTGSARRTGSRRIPLQQAIACSLDGDRKSLPSLLMVSRDLSKVLRDRHPEAPQTRDYLEHLNTLAEASAPSV
jgi:hypothetical protein